ncbi:hypothetical protein [Burkholderia cepacia]|uniref:hypothetical protein n=1 Tax=Burkholderia cepacia TaxID=292 RepID=UPI002ABD8779|nr:hypothetical protein [Burkholderia cepacia]
MATNDFLVFGGGSSPNVIDQPSYAALAARLAGFQSGTALSAQLNKVWRQSSIMAAVLAQFTANFSGQNSVDDGTTATLLANLQAAINAAGITAPQFDSSTSFATTAFVQRALGNYAGALVINAASTLTKAAAGQIVELNGTSTFITTLPLSAVVGVGGRMAFINQSGVDQTVATQGTENIWSYFGGLVSSIVLHSGDSLELFSRGGQWDICGGTVGLRNVQGATTQTPPQFDNSTKIATTASVNLRGMAPAGALAYGSNQTLTGAQAGSIVYLTGAGGITITLPPASSVLSSGGFLLSNLTSGTVTVAPQAGNFIDSGATFLAPGDNLMVLSDASSSWHRVFHSNMQNPNFSGQPTAVTPGQFDNSNRLATTAFAQRASGGVVGAVRNASMYVSAVSASANFTADEIVVETALGGGLFRLAGFNKAINLAATGAGGMDTGAAPANGYVALYAIYNPSTASVALLATNATSSVAPSVYSGANMPSGYTASALVSVWPTNGSGQFAAGFQADRKISITNVNVLSTSTVQASILPLSIANAVPPNAKTARGFASVGTSASNAYGTFNAASSTAGLGLQQFQGQLTGSFTMNVTFDDVQMIAQQTLCYAVIVNTGTMSANIYVSGYTF